MDLLGQGVAKQSGRAPEGASQTERRDSIQSRLETCVDVLGQCISLTEDIEMRIAGPGPSDPQKTPEPPPCLSATTLELGNRARLLRDRLETIVNALA